MANVPVIASFTPEQIGEALIAHFSLPLDTEIEFVNVTKQVGYGMSEREETSFEGAKAKYSAEFKTS